VLLTPVAMVNAFRHSQAPLDADIDEINFIIHERTVPYRYLGVYPSLATLCGQPATVFPAGKTPSGLPIGLQAVGLYLEDLTPIQFAALMGEAIGGFTPPPNYP
jgi:amidase